MNQKTTVTVTNPDGKIFDNSSDTVMVFTVNGLKAVLEEKSNELNNSVIYAGKGIPPQCFAEIIAGLIINLTGNYFKNPIETSFQISEIADRLREHSDKLEKETIDDIGEQELKKFLMDFLMKS